MNNEELTIIDNAASSLNIVNLISNTNPNTSRLNISELPSIAQKPSFGKLTCF